jgi:dienelactone hydrolase
MRRAGRRAEEQAGALEDALMSSARRAIEQRVVMIPIGQTQLEGNLHLPPSAAGVVLFAHGSGSSRHSPRNRWVASQLNEVGLATLLIDLLTAEEEHEDRITTAFRFDIDLLASRLVCATDWLERDERTRALPVGYFGASTGAGAALVAAANRPERVGAVVSRGGRPDLADDELERVCAPTLLIVGGHDEPVIRLNQTAIARMRAHVELEIIPAATHLFEEPGALDAVAQLAAQWFRRYLPAGARELHYRGASAWHR